MMGHYVAFAFNQLSTRLCWSLNRDKGLGGPRVHHAHPAIAAASCRASAPSAAGRAGEPSGSSVEHADPPTPRDSSPRGLKAKTVISVKGDTMARKSRIVSAAKSSKRPRRTRSPIPEPFQIVSSATVTAGATDIKVPMLVLYGEWLKAIGFPIG